MSCLSRKIANMTSAGGEADFDFFHGGWRVAHRRLRTRLRGCADWDAFGGHCVVRPLLGGFGNLDDNMLDLPTGAYRAVTLRSFDPSTRRWAIWWLDGRAPHQLDAPMIGAFEGGLGLFYADDTFEGRAIRVRFSWSGTQSGSPCWEQAFSVDGGASWEVNWTMRFSRADVDF
jgi:hypothetical protein